MESTLIGIRFFNALIICLLCVVRGDNEEESLRTLLGGVNAVRRLDVTLRSSGPSNSAHSYQIILEECKRRCKGREGEGNSSEEVMIWINEYSALIAI